MTALTIHLWMPRQADLGFHNSYLALGSFLFGCVLYFFQPREMQTAKVFDSLQSDKISFIRLPIEYIYAHMYHWFLSRGDIHYIFVLASYIYGPRQAKTCLRGYVNCSDSYHPAYAQSHPGICSPLKHSMGRAKRKGFIPRMRKILSGHLLLIDTFVSNDSVSGQRRPALDYADAQADLSRRCPLMPEDTFSHGAAHIWTDL